jgi:hypothetical protein
MTSRAADVIEVSLLIEINLLFDSQKGASTARVAESGPRRLGFGVRRRAGETTRGDSDLRSVSNTPPVNPAAVSGKGATGFVRAAATYGRSRDGLGGGVPEYQKTGWPETFSQRVFHFYGRTPGAGKPREMDAPALNPGAERFKNLNNSIRIYEDGGAHAHAARASGRRVASIKRIVCTL